MPDSPAQILRWKGIQGNIPWGQSTKYSLKPCQRNKTASIHLTKCNTAAMRFVCCQCRQVGIEKMAMHWDFIFVSLENLDVNCATNFGSWMTWNRLPAPLPSSCAMHWHFYPIRMTWQWQTKSTTAIYYSEMVPFCLPSIGMAITKSISRAVEHFKGIPK